MRYRALVADEDPRHREQLARILASHGFDVSVVHDAEELFELLWMTPPDCFRLLVVDEAMPRLHGADVLARPSRRTRFLVTSTRDTPERRAAALRHGAAAFMQKPVDAARFVALVDQISFVDTRPD